MNNKKLINLRSNTLYVDVNQADKHKIRLYEYVEILKARNVIELSQLNIVVANIKGKVNRERAKLGLSKLG